MSVFVCLFVIFFILPLMFLVSFACLSHHWDEEECYDDVMESYSEFLKEFGKILPNGC